MKKGTYASFSLFFTLIAAGFFACNAGREPAVESSGDLAEDIIKHEIILSPEAQDFLNRFPSPIELSSMLRDARAPYLFSLCNSPDNLGRYFTERTKAVNLGVYSADLAYSSLYRMIDASDKFLYCVSKLANDLGIAVEYDKDLIRKANRYGDNTDSLAALAKRFFKGTGDFLRRNNRNQVAVLAASGAFAEGVYIASALARLSPDNREILHCLGSQKETLDRLLSVLEEYGSDSNVRPVADKMKELKAIYSPELLDSQKPLNTAELAKIAEITASTRAYLVK